ncbi:hypothetical protein LTR66_009569 [Elasticomyces elasticus]|nr:hypothetical protein LTR66_009569 [Elasticomyces elasticus]KAK4992022.1 hypothetical protein LTR50_001418 [Elasticomyces elasticus]KAK5003609.1 hypothetical protein LTR28_009956 [Elasticomyces elasticus]
MRKHGSLANDAETNEAAWIAARGAVYGAATWGVYSALLAGAGYALSPIYRGLTIQFKVFLQMSGMTLGSMIEADRRLRAHEVMVRRHRRIARDAEVWRRYEQDFESNRVVSGVGEEGGVEQEKGR